MLLLFFRDSETRLEQELDTISSDKVEDVRSSALYKALRELMETLTATER